MNPLSKIAPIAAALLLWGCATEPPLTADRLAAQFSRVAFGDEYDPKRRIGRIRKWTGPVRIALRGAWASRYRATARDHAVALAKLTGLSVDVLPPGAAGANLTVHFARWDDMEALARPYAPRPEWLRTIIQTSSCLFIFRRDAGWRITGGIVLVSTDEPFEHNRRCLLEEMTQALGLPNDSNLIRESVFHETGGFDGLPAADRVLLGALYDPRMTPGMPRAEAMALFRRILAEKGWR